MSIYVLLIEKIKKHRAKADFVIGMSFYILLIEEIEIRQDKGRFCHSDVNLYSTNWKNKKKT